MMDKVGAARGVAYMGIQYVIQFASLMVFYFFAVRLLTEQQIGIVVFFVFFINIIPVLTQLAVPVASAKYISEYLGKGDSRNASRVSKTSSRLVAGLTVSTHIALFLAFPWFTHYFVGQIDLTTMLCLILVSAVTNLFTIEATNLQGLLSLGKMATVLSASNAIGRGLSIVLIFYGFGLSGVPLGWLIGALFAAVAGYLFLRNRFQKPVKGFSVKRLLSYSWPVLTFQLMIQAQTWVDVWILYALIPDLAILATYHLVMTGALVITIAAYSVTTVIFPVVSSQYAKGSVEEVCYSLRAASRVLNFLVIPFGVVLASLSPMLIEVVFGWRYIAGSPAFTVSCLFAIIPAYNLLYVTALQAIGDTKPLVAIVVVSFVADVVAAYILTPIFGIVGTALARSVMYAITAVVSYCFLRRRLTPPMDLGSLAKMILFSLTIGLPLYLIDVLIVYWFGFTLLIGTAILIGSAVLLFFVAGAIWKPLNYDDFNVLIRAFPGSLRGVVNSLRRFFCKKENQSRGEEMRSN
nr:oligosaccharide flippase family protein [Candidatus Njordarchaeum guaymaensis]